MGIYQYTLDATVVTDPIGWNTIKAGHTRFLDTRGATIFKPSGSLTFVEDGFDYISNQFDVDGVCGKIELLVEYKESDDAAFATLFEGVIYLSDCEFDLENNFVTVAEVVDNSYISLINVNADIKAQLDVDRSKNDTTITAVSTVDIDFFNSTTGGYGFLNRPMYLIYDILEYLVAFCSDGNLTFDSTVFGAGGDYEGAAIILGSALRTGTNANITTSWTDVLKQIYVKFNVVPIVDDSGATPEIRVESAADTYIETVSTTFQGTGIKGLKRRGVPFSAGPSVYNGDKPISVFTNYRVGSKTTIDTGPYPDIRFKSWDDEEYHILGDCGFKQTFDIVGDWIVDSNIIDAVLGGDTSYDNDIFLVETDGTTQATQYTVINPGANPYTYNDGLTNENVTSRFFGAIPNSIATYLGDGNDGFQAEKTGTSSSAGGSLDINPADFDDDFTPPNNDPNGNYNNATYRYTIPSSGFYVFRAIVEYSNVTTTPVQAPSFTSTITIRRYDSGATLQETRVQIDTVSSDTTITFNALGFYAAATDYIDVRIQGLTDGPGPGVASWDVDQAFFLTTSVDNSGGIYQTFDPASFRGSYYLFNVPMSFTDFLAMTSYPTKNEAVFIDRGGFPDDITGWLISADLDLGNNMATIELVAT